MIGFVERSTGASLKLVVGRSGRDAVNLALYSACDPIPIGGVTYVYQKGARGELTTFVFNIRVTDHVNELLRKANPHPGVGRLLMYLVCQYAQRNEVDAISLGAAAHTQGFYLKMGMHPAPDPNPGDIPDPGGVLDQGWMEAFQRRFNHGHRPTRWEGRVSTVLSTIAGEVEAQWRKGPYREPFITIM